MKNPKQQQQLQQAHRALSLQKQMTTATPFTIAQVIAQATILQTAMTQAFTDASKYITDLQAAIAAGNPVTQDQLNTLGTMLTSATTATQAFDVTNTEPVAPIATLPPVTTT